MKFQSTILLFTESFPTQIPRAAMSQLRQIAQRHFNIVVQLFTKLIMGLTSHVSPKLFSFYMLLFALITVIPCAPVFSANVSVTWDKNSESDLAGYKIYKRTLPSQDFGQPVFSGMPSNPSSPATTVSGLNGGTTYGFIATAFDTAGNESAPSTEKQISVPSGSTSPPPSSALSISNLTVASGKSYVVTTSGLQAGGTVYIDRNYTFTTIPSLVQGATFIRTANDDKATTNTTFLTFSVNQPVSVYVAHGDRITSKPAWLNTFTDTGANLVTSDTTLSLFVRTFPAGTITLGGNVSSGTAGNSLSMYSVLVKPDGAPPADTTAPTVTLTAPSAGTVSGTVTVSASASDTIGVAGVQFRLQGANLGSEDTTNPYSTSWNTTTVPNGSYTLTAIARDAAGNTTTSASRTVTVSNTTTPPTDTTPPTVTLTAPSAGTVSGTVTVSASASDTVGVAGVQFRLQGANLGAEDTTNPYSTSWNTTTVPNGSYILTAIARDAAGNTTTSTSRTVTVSNASPPPPPSGGAPVTAWTAAAQIPGGNWNNSSWDNRSIRILLPGSAITTNGTTVQLTLQGRTSGNYTVQRVSLVRRDGTTLNGVDSTHRQLTFGGTWNAGGTVPAGGTLTSDPIPFDLLAGQDVFVTFWVPAGNPTVYRNGGNNTVGWTITGTDQSTAIDWSSLSTSNTSQNIYVVGKLDVLPASGGDNTPPTVALTAPSAGTVSGTVTVSASASDTVGVTGVQFRLQGANLGAEDTTNPYSTSWNTTTVPNGSYTLTATARDAAGNTTTSAPRTVTVSNTTTPPPPPPTSTLNISNLNVSSGKAYVVPTSGLQAGGTVYVDRAYTFTTIPTLIQGATYIRTANDDKGATNTTFLSFTVNQPVSVYVAHGDRITPKPAWLNTFTDTGANLVTSDTTLSLFVRTFPAGTITLGGNVSSGTAGNLLSMYSVIVKP